MKFYHAHFADVKGQLKNVPKVQVLNPGNLCELVNCYTYFLL